MNPISLQRTGRRQFLKAAALGAAALPNIIVSSAWNARGGRPSDKITLGFIGIGVMGRGHLSRLAKNPRVEVVAVCDVVQERIDHSWNMVSEAYAERKRSGKYQGCAALGDFRDVIARRDIDAVLIATPDHWHAVPAIMAAEAGKDIFCEKPLTLFIAEGRRLVEAVRKNGVVFQTGSQQRSEFGGKFHRACELVRNGRIGRVKTVRVGVGAPPVPCDLPSQEAPAGTNWEMWVGPSPHRGYNEILCPKGVHNHFPAFRNYREFAGGGLADMGAHHFDIAQWALGMDDGGPVRIEPPAGNEVTGLKFTYANGVEMFHGGPSGCTFEGTEGRLYVDRDKLEADPAGILESKIGPNEVHLYRATNHHANWLDCVRSRSLPICDAEIGHRTATVCHLANIGYELRRPLNWDPVQEQFVNDVEANQKVARIYRAPW